VGKAQHVAFGPAALSIPRLGSQSLRRRPRLPGRRTGTTADYAGAAPRTTTGRFGWRFAPWRWGSTRKPRVAPRPSKPPWGRSWTAHGLLTAASLGTEALRA